MPPSPSIIRIARHMCSLTFFLLFPRDRRINVYTEITLRSAHSSNRPNTHDILSVEWVRCRAKSPLAGWEWTMVMCSGLFFFSVLVFLKTMTTSGACVFDICYRYVPLRVFKTCARRSSWERNSYWFLIGTVWGIFVQQIGFCAMEM